MRNEWDSLVMQLSFRAATLDDVDAVVALVESAYRGEASRVGWTTEADLLDGQRTDPAGVLDVIEGPDSLLMLGFVGNELVACCQLQRHDDASCYFGMFAVRPALQGGGAGKLVLAEAERRAREDWHCSSMRMTVIAQRRDLIAWYMRRGYVETGDRKPFPYGDERFGLPQRDDLAFAVLTKQL